MSTLRYSLVRPTVAQPDLTTVAQFMFWQMFRNVASDGFVFEDPVNAGVLSRPGCVLALPSVPPGRRPRIPSRFLNTRSTTGTRRWARSCPAAHTGPRAARVRGITVTATKF